MYGFISKLLGMFWGLVQALIYATMLVLSQQLPMFIDNLNLHTSIHKDSTANMIISLGLAYQVFFDKQRTGNFLKMAMGFARAYFLYWEAKTRV